MTTLANFFTTFPAPLVVLVGALLTLFIVMGTATAMRVIIIRLVERMEFLKKEEDDWDRMNREVEELLQSTPISHQSQMSSVQSLEED